MNCRHCGTALVHGFLDLGFAPPSNAYVDEEQLSKPETYYPLKTKVCTECWLVQTEDYTTADELFDSDYAYFSSTSSSWLAHARSYANDVIERFELNATSLAIEVASNDGYLLKNFMAANIPCLGIEPTDSTADAAEAHGIPVLREFFGESLAKRLAASNKKADLIVGNNVYAHVPMINDFTLGLKSALKANGVITLEFPHLLQMLMNLQFDTVYHEHFSYLSLHTVSRIFEQHGLRVWDVELLSTHGGSLRVFGCHNEDLRKTSEAVIDVLHDEEKAGLQSISIYKSFQAQAAKIKNEFLSFLLEKKRAGETVIAYGAAAKGNTLLNYAGIGPDLLEIVCDAAPSKQGKFMPGSHIPILSPSRIEEYRPDYVVILPWNLADEVVEQNSVIRQWGGKFVTAVPSLVVF